MTDGEDGERGSMESMLSTHFDDDVKQQYFLDSTINVRQESFCHRAEHMFHALF